MTNARAETLFDKQRIRYEREPGGSRKAKSQISIAMAARIFGVKLKRLNHCRIRSVHADPYARGRALRNLRLWRHRSPTARLMHGIGMRVRAIAGGLDRNAGAAE